MLAREICLFKTNNKNFIEKYEKQTPAEILSRFVGYTWLVLVSALAYKVDTTEC